MEYVINLMDAAADPVTWAKTREDQGWQVLSVADHLYSENRPYPHVWVTAGAMAAATSDVQITTAFVNNLFRSPVEVAQAALMMQSVSGGRFELGLGAGWARDEIVGASLTYPEPRDRAGAFIEAAQIIRSLLHSASCRFSGEYYQINVDGLGPLSSAPPPLVCSVGGPRTVREVTPFADRIEIKASSSATRGGHVDLAAMAKIPDAHLLEMIERVRSVDPDIQLGMFVFCNVGEDQRTKDIATMMGPGLCGRFFGAPAKVAEGMAWLQEVGISRAQISPIDDVSFDRLAPVLLR